MDLIYLIISDLMTMGFCDKKWRLIFYCLNLFVLCHDDILHFYLSQHIEPVMDCSPRCVSDMLFYRGNAESIDWSYDTYVVTLHVWICLVLLQQQYFICLLLKVTLNDVVRVTKYVRLINSNCFYYLLKFPF